MILSVEAVMCIGDNHVEKDVGLCFLSHAPNFCICSLCYLQSEERKCHKVDTINW